MNILLLSTSFFGYSDRVAKELSKNHNVQEARAYNFSVIERILSKINIHFKIKSNSFYQRILLDNRNRKYDRVIVFGGGMPYFFLKLLKQEHKESYFLLYLSADMTSYGFTNDYINLFDKVLTYSLNEATLYGFKYRAWYFSNIQTEKKIFDISFIGTIHDSRYPILRFIKKIKTFKLFYYIYSERLSLLRRLNKWYPFLLNIHFKGLDYSEYINILAKSKCTLDIPEVSQTNITTRPIEALATKTKIITTNKYISRYDFYCSENVLIVDLPINDETICSIESWINIPFKEIDDSIKKYYSIETFCCDLIV